MFSKYDVYTTVQSMYCYPDTDVLINKLNIRELIRCMALEYGLHINWGNTDRETLINAAIAAVDDDMAFCDVLMQCVETKN